MSLEEFIHTVDEELKNEIPKDPKRSALTGRIILPLKQYNRLQTAIMLGPHNKWCTGVDEGIDPGEDHELLSSHYLKVGDSENFAKLFITESMAEEEAKQAATQEIAD